MENIFEDKVAENFPNLGKKTDIHFQEAQRVQNKKNPKKSTPRCIVSKVAKVKDREKILKTAREKHLVTYKGTPIRLTVDFSA